MADWVASNIKKGDAVVVEGRLRWREWEDDNNNKRQAIDITANSIVPVTRDGQGGGSSGRSYSDSDADIPIDTGDLPDPGAGAAAPAGGDDDIPF
jgi:single-strand DNA-binding protein